MPATAKTLLRSDVGYLATTTVGSQLQIEYVLFTQPRQRDRGDAPARKADEVVRNSARFLEFLLIAVCAHEALAETGAETFEASAKEPPYFLERVRELTGLDPVEVIKEAERGSLLKNVPPPESRMPPMSEVVRAARTVIEACPITKLEALANARGLQALGHRCRVAYDALRAFVLRRDPREQDRLGVVGREYARGALSLKDVAALLQADAVDAVVLLEDHGYVRPIEKILVGEEEWLERYARIREDRLSRAGKFQPTPEQIARDVIASERIEGVDARHWIRPEVD